MDKQHLNFMEFSKLALDFTSKLDIEADCLYCFKNTKDQIHTLVDFMQCQRDEIRPFNMCQSVSKKLGCKKYMDDVCRAEVRYMPLECSKESLCEASEDLFKRYAGIDTTHLNLIGFQDLVLHVMYEMEFLPAIDVEKVSSFTGQVVPTGITKNGLGKNLLTHWPTSEQQIFAPSIPVLDEHFPVK